MSELSRSDVQHCQHGKPPTFHQQWSPTGRRATYEELEPTRWGFSYECPCPQECEQDEAARLLGVLAHRESRNLL